MNSILNYSSSAAEKRAKIWPGPWPSGPATPDEIAEAAVFFSTDHASFIQGAKPVVEGGRTAI